jgi:hypothetical protein
MTLLEMEARLKTNDEQYGLENCRKFDALLCVTLEWLKSIRNEETSWREALKRKEAPYDSQVDRLFFQKYREWLKQAEVRSKQLEMQESGGCHPASSAEFRQWFEEIDDKVRMRARADIGAEARRQMLNADAE